VAQVLVHASSLHQCTAGPPRRSVISASTS
jgi:hypothetical protein